MKRILLHSAITHTCALLLGVVVVFALTLGLPDPAYRLAGAFADEGSLQALRDEFHLDASPPVRFALYWRGLFSGKITSLYSREPLLEVLPKKLLVTFNLFVGSLACLAVMTAMWFWLLLKFGKMQNVVNLLVGSAASLPLFISGTFLLYGCTMLGIPGWIGASLALAIFPSLLLSTNLVQRWESARSAPYRVLEVHYGVSGSAWLQRRLREFAPAATILFNAMTFYLVAGFAVAEQIFGIPGLGRWLLESIIRLDIPVMFLVGVLLAVLTAGLSFINELFSSWADPRNSNIEVAL